MSTSMIPFDPAKLALSLKSVAREAAPIAAFLRMTKEGEWCYGIEAIEVGETERFMVNPGGFQHGYVCWATAGSEKLGEITAPVTEALAETGPVPGGGRGWEFQLGMHLKGLDGELKDVELVYRASSVGGKRAIAGLAEAVAKRLTDGDSEIVPVVTLSSDNYKHKTYGKIYTPEISIVKWIAMPKAASAAKAAPEKPVKPKSRR